MKMPVGHGGCMSKHPAWVKIAILEFLEARLKDAADAVGIGADKVTTTTNPLRAHYKKNLNQVYQKNTLTVNTLTKSEKLSTTLHVKVTLIVESSTLPRLKPRYSTQLHR